MRKLGGTLAAIAVAGLLVAIAATPSNAALKHARTRSSAFDGLWSVVIHTAAGPCDATYRYPARIRAGLVVQAENDFSYQISGVVLASGGISVTVSKGGQNATGYGKLLGTRGGGHWSAAGSACYGTWNALRRG